MTKCTDYSPDEFDSLPRLADHELNNDSADCPTMYLVPLPLPLREEAEIYAYIQLSASMFDFFTLHGAYVDRSRNAWRIVATGFIADRALPIRFDVWNESDPYGQTFIYGEW